MSNTIEPTTAGGGHREQTTDAPTLQLYMVEHAALRLRKVGITASDRLDTWRRRGWSVVETIAYDSTTALRAAEGEALDRLDGMGARATPHMAALYPNLDANGRTEMYDPTAFAGTLSELLGDAVGADVEAAVMQRPAWIVDAARHAATKAWTTGRLAAKRAAADAARASRPIPSTARSSAARKAWVTRRAAAPAATASTPDVRGATAVDVESTAAVGEAAARTATKAE